MSVQTDTSTLRSLIHENYPPSCSSADDLDAVSSALSDTDFLFPQLYNTSPIQDRLASYYTVGRVLISLPSPVPKRFDRTMRWPESVRLPTKVRASLEILEQCIRECDVRTSKKEDFLLDVLPLWRIIDGNLTLRTKRNLKELCEYPLRGKQVSTKEAQVEEEVIEQGHTGGWLEDDDIED